jgi:uncharacterized membrane protein
MRAIRLLYASILLAVCLPLLTACAGLGLTAPATPEQKLYAGFGTAAQAEALATNMLNAHMISSAKAEDIQTAARGVTAVLNSYFQAVGTEHPQNAVAVLAGINASLIKLEVFLAERGAK